MRAIKITFMIYYIMSVKAFFSHHRGEEQVKQDDK